MGEYSYRWFYGDGFGNPKVVLDSFIVSNTPSHEMKKLWGIDKPAMQTRHIVFQEEGKDSYVRAMLEEVSPSP